MGDLDHFREQPRWKTSAECSHANYDSCPTCDFDSYYALTYEDCPWRAERLSALTASSNTREETR